MTVVSILSVNRQTAPAHLIAEVVLRCGKKPLVLDPCPHPFSWVFRYFWFFLLLGAGQAVLSGSSCICQCSSSSSSSSYYYYYYLEICLPMHENKQNFARRSSPMPDFLNWLCELIVLMVALQQPFKFKTLKIHNKSSVSAITSQLSPNSGEMFVHFELAGILKFNTRLATGHL